MSKRAINEATQIVAHRYHTADPFTIAEKLNIEVDWVYLGKSPLGKIIYDDKQPIVMLNKSIRDSPMRYFTMAHELGHTIMQEGLVGYYCLNNWTHSELENEANEFAVSLLAQLYIEENGRLPNDYLELTRTYGMPGNETLNSSILGK
ncbi:prophage protein [Secundilactobacillus pentosiphilus]|uniref:Prophage protein n=1 Tax=Secundilactobacillus pentosiphilus TaxID=1714682 RepID=A0A1Z5IQT3_9LACO|nr:ImmA/IrrE family metallo-endopeptidase [Secundilactobacillus pentosiphilus]GAX04123.1 prophage protein [Secundilactobacillus pentosiphilus]